MGHRAAVVRRAVHPARAGQRYAQSVAPRLGRSWGVELREVTLSLSDTEAIKRAVMAGLGLAAVSHLCIGLELAAGLLVELPVKGLNLRRSLYEVTLRNRQASPSVQAFARLLTNQHPPR